MAGIDPQPAPPAEMHPLAVEKAMSPNVFSSPLAECGGTMRSGVQSRNC